MIPKNQKKSRPRTSSRPAQPVPPPGYEQHQGEISLRMSHFFMRYLSAIYQEFDGDLALVIVLGEVAHHNVSQFFSSAGPLPPFGKTNYDDPNLYKNLVSCNAFSLAAATNIPRETVRRKIDQLVKRGWLHKEPNGSVRIRLEVAQHFRPDFNVRLLQELLEVSDQLKAVLASARKHKPGLH